MSTRVYLSKHTCETTHEEDTPVCIRIQLSHTTVKDLHSCLQHAYRHDDVRLVRRITVLIDRSLGRGCRGARTPGGPVREPRQPVGPGPGHAEGAHGLCGGGAG